MAKTMHKPDPMEIQKKYVQFELLGKELEQIESQKELVSAKAKELQVLRHSLDQLSKGEGFSQLGEGIFVPAKFTDTNTFIVDVGKKIYVKMNKLEAEKHLDRRVSEFGELMQKIEERSNELTCEIQSLAVELQEMGGI